jgi:hypothetical protein
MVAVIKTGHSIHRMVNYNEKKLKEGKAECISAGNYPMDVEHLSLSNKLNRLLNQAALNENVSRKSVHISLNFDPSETLSNSLLQQIADDYMQRIGFGNQPYLVYRHFDSGHPHIHIISIKVRSDGSRIDTQNIGRNQSETARKEMEILYSLKKAEDSKQRQAYELKPVNVQKVQFGKAETKKAITNVLDAVIKNYKYTSLPELNAVLKQYNVMADRGSENSRVYQTQGLTYRIVDEQGNKVGVPIKASDFYNKPTLTFLEERFKLNEAARISHKVRVKNAVDLAFIRLPEASLKNLIKSVENQGIDVALRQNADGIIYGITYIDHHTKCVFNGSDLGKNYSANAIIERCKTSVKEHVDKHKSVQQKEATLGQESIPHQSSYQNKESLLDVLLKPEYTSSYIPYQLTINGKKKKKKGISKRL